MSGPSRSIPRVLPNSQRSGESLEIQVCRPTDPLYRVSETVLAMHVIDSVSCIHIYIDVGTATPRSFTPFPPAAPDTDSDPA